MAISITFINVFLTASDVLLSMAIVGHTATNIANRPTESYKQAVDIFYDPFDQKAWKELPRQGAKLR